MQSRAPLCLFLSLIAVHVSARAATCDYAAIGRHAQAGLAQTSELPGFAGATLSVGGPGHEANWSAGKADIELNVPMQSHNRSRVGSVSKTIAVATMLRMREKGMLDIDQPIGTYLADISPQLKPISIRQLVTHSSGIRHFTLADERGFTVPLNYGEDSGRLRRWDSAILATSWFGNDPLLFDPGARSSYSSFGTILLSAVLESVGGKPFPDLVAEHVTEPLKLRMISADEPNLLIDGRATPYSWSGGMLTRARPADQSGLFAGGGMLAAAPDLVRFGRALFSDGFLSPASRKLLRTVPANTPGQEIYGFGWELITAGAYDGLVHDQSRLPDPPARLAQLLEGAGSPDRILFHSGGTAGGIAMLAVAPDHDVAVAFVANTGIESEALDATLYHLVFRTLSETIEASRACKGSTAKR